MTKIEQGKRPRGERGVLGEISEVFREVWRDLVFCTPAHLEIERAAVWSDATVDKLTGRLESIHSRGVRGVPGRRR